MDSTKKITSIFMVVALIAMAALAVSVNQKAEDDPEPEPMLLPGLAENLRSMEKITGFPASHVRSVRIKRTDGEELAVAREQPDSQEFQFEASSPDSIAPFSGILFANASFLENLRSTNAFTVMGFSDELVIGELTYTSFDGLVLKFIVFRAEDATWLRMIASHSQKLADRYDESGTTGLLPPDAIIETARRLNGRVYKKPDDE